MRFGFWVNLELDCVVAEFELTKLHDNSLNLGEEWPEEWHVFIESEDWVAYIGKRYLCSDGIANGYNYGDVAPNHQENVDKIRSFILRSVDVAVLESHDQVEGKSKESYEAFGQFNE